MAPGTVQGTAFQEDDSADAGTVIQAKAGYVKDDAAGRPAAGIATCRNQEFSPNSVRSMTACFRAGESRLKYSE